MVDLAAGCFDASLGLFTYCCLLLSDLLDVYLYYLIDGCLIWVLLLVIWVFMMFCWELAETLVGDLYAGCFVVL